MSGPLVNPETSGKALRNPQVNLPPSARGRVALKMTAAAAEGRFELQVCEECGALQYPPREACHQCLSSQLKWRIQSGKGQLLALTTLHHSNDLYFRDRLPWRLGLVRLDAGPSVIVHLHDAVGAAPAQVRVGVRLDRAGQAVLIGFPTQGSEHMADDKMLAELSSDPRCRKVLVTDGTSAVGRAVVQALVDAGAQTVWVGHAAPWRIRPGLEDISRHGQVVLVPLDLTSSRSVSVMAGAIGSELDIVVHTAEVHGTFGIASSIDTECARAEMDVNYFGLLRLAQALGPVLRARSAACVSHSLAWVNLLSIYALANLPALGSFSASKAAALSLSQCLRAEMRPAGIRVVNVFPGPIDDEPNHTMPALKLAPATVAGAIINALRQGIEDVYPGEVAQEWRQRWRDDPKVLERELAEGGG